MQKRLVKYRTQFQSKAGLTDNHNDYAIVPIMWLNDFLVWLKTDNGSVVVSIENTDGPITVPMTWPCYGTCLDYVTSVNLVADNGKGDR
jgi:hypothetical protein